MHHNRQIQKFGFQNQILGNKKSKIKKLCINLLKVEVKEV